jgi:hypothetical protein
MKKLSLDLDALRVESFEATPTRPARRGTVRGNDSFTTTTTGPETTFCAEEHSGEPCVYTLVTACPIDACEV